MTESTQTECCMHSFVNVQWHGRACVHACCMHPPNIGILIEIICNNLPFAINTNECITKTHTKDVMPVVMCLHRVKSEVLNVFKMKKSILYMYLAHGITKINKCGNTCEIVHIVLCERRMFAANYSIQTPNPVAMRIRFFVLNPFATTHSLHSFFFLDGILFFFLRLGVHLIHAHTVCARHTEAGLFGKSCCKTST